MQNPILKKIISVCLIFAPIVSFWYIFEKYAINIPHWDDFAVRNSLANFLQAGSFIEKIKILFAQHNEHRIFLTRLATLLIYEIKGTIDYQWLMIVANFSLLGILFLFFKISKKYKFHLIALAPISFLIFNVGLFENTFWGMASIQNFGVIFLAFLTFYLLVFSIEIRYKNYIYLAAISCFFGVFTSYNGIVIPIIGLLILAFQQRKQAFLLWFGISFAFLFAYFYTFTKNPEKQAEINFSNPQLLLKGLFATFGSAIDSSFGLPNRQIDLSVAVGIFLVIFMVMFAYQTIFKKYNISLKTIDLFLLACLAFLVITCVGIVLSRISFGFGILLSSKYKIYSVLIFCIFYLVALQSFSEKRKKTFILLAIFSTIIFNIYTYIADYQAIKQLRHERIADQFKQYHTERDFPANGIYAQLQQPVSVFYDTLIGKILHSSDSLKINLKITENKTSFKIEENLNGKSIDLSSADDGQYFILKSAEKVYLFPAKTIAQSKKSYLNQDFLLENRLSVGSFAAEVSKLYMQSGKYQIGKILVENGIKTLAFSNQTIDIQAVRKNKVKQNW